MPNRRERAGEPPGSFEGFDLPEQNWFRMPNYWTDITADITNIAELKVVEYILRHTWGYREFGIKKHITVDEFIRGRKRKDGSRMDKGTGLSERSVRYGLADALRDDLIEEEVDASDRARVKKYYSLKMKPSVDRRGGEVPDADIPEELAERGVQDLPAGVQSLHPGVQDLPPRGAEFAPRTEKETLGQYLEDELISNERNSNIYHSKDKDAKLSTALRIQSTVDNPRGREGLTDASERPPAPTGWTAVTEVAHRLFAKEEPPEGSDYAGRRGRPPKLSDRCARRVAEDSEWLHDHHTPVKSNISRAAWLWKDSGLPEPTFYDLLGEAKSKARDETKPKKHCPDHPGTYNRMPLYFAAIEQLLGLRDEHGRRVGESRPA
jgi:hypothetical protein